MKMKRPRNSKPTRFEPVDLEIVMLLGRLSPARRVRTMLETQAFLMSAIRGRIRRQFPDLSQREINLKVFEEIARYG